MRIFAVTHDMNSRVTNLYGAGSTRTCVIRTQSSSYRPVLDTNDPFRVTLFREVYRNLQIEILFS
jgi:hypothetical protein